MRNFLSGRFLAEQSQGKPFQNGEGCKLCQGDDWNPAGNDI